MTPPPTTTTSWLGLRHGRPVVAPTVGRLGHRHQQVGGVRIGASRPCLDDGDPARRRQHVVDAIGGDAEGWRHGHVDGRATARTPSTPIGSGSPGSIWVTNAGPTPR